MTMILIIQYLLGIVQVALAIIGTLFQLFKYQNLNKHLKTYWIMVIIYFAVLFLLSLVAEPLTFIWFFTAWIIAGYWFYHFFRLFERPETAKEK